MKADPPRLEKKIVIPKDPQRSSITSSDHPINILPQYNLELRSGIIIAKIGHMSKYMSGAQNAPRMWRSNDWMTGQSIETAEKENKQKKQFVHCLE